MKVKRLVSMALALVISFTSVPMTAHAEEAVKTDYTDVIVNANLETAGGGWDDRETKGIEDGMCKVSSGKIIDFCQIITLPAGQYKLNANAVCRYGGDEQTEYDAIQMGEDTHLAQLYAQTSAHRYEVDIKNRYEGASENNHYSGDDVNTAVSVVNELFVPNSSKAVASWFAVGKYENELIFNVQEESEVRIGISKQVAANAGDYTNIGKWKLTRLGDAEADPVHVHKEVIVAGQEATCIVDGLTEGIICETCGEVIKEQTKIDALGHKWDAGVVTKEPTETETGIRTYTCQNNAKHTKTEEIPKITVKPETPEVPKTSKAVGETILTAEATYVVTVAGTAPEVTFKAPAKKTSKKVTVPSTIECDTITYKVTSIEKNAFKGCKKLSSVTVSEGIKEIGANAFKSAKNLKKLTIKSTVLTKVGKGAFKGIHKKATIKVPKKQKKAYQRLLKKKGQASSVKIK